MVSTQNVNVARFARSAEMRLFLWFSNTVFFFQFHVVCNYTFGSVFISAFFSDLPWRVEKKIDAWLTFGSFQTSSRLLRLLLDDLFFCLESWNPRFEMRLVRLFLFFKLLILYVKANSFHLRDLKATPTTYMISRSFFLRIISNSVEQNRTDVCNYFNYILMKVFNSDQMHNFL